MSWKYCGDQKLSYQCQGDPIEIKIFEISILVLLSSALLMVSTIFPVIAKKSRIF